MNQEPEMVTVRIACTVKARYDQTVQMTRQHFDELDTRIEDDDDVEDDVFGYLDLQDPYDFSLDFGAVDDFEIVNETEETAAE